LSLIGDTGIDRIMDFAFDSAGTMWATTGNELYTIDTATAASQHAASISGVETATNDPNAEIMGIMFDENDVLYATAFIESAPLFTIDIVTGQTTVDAKPGLSFPHGGAFLSTGPNKSGKILYVKADSAGANEGTTWTDAYNDLQLALDAAEPGDEIWVAAGTYVPTKPGLRDATFRLKTGVGLYGGFAGTEDDRGQREPAANETTLSGDLNGDDIVIATPLDLIEEPSRSDNSYHVITGSGADQTAVLDGFIIIGGNANGNGDRSDGGGMINILTPAGGRNAGAPIPANPTVTNCTFLANSADRNGGGIYNDGVDVTLTNCTFMGNYSNAPGNFDQGGGGVYNIKSNPTLVNCTFIDNMAADDGAGMTNQNSSPTLLNCMFMHNTCGSGPNIGVGAGMYNNSGSEPTLVNCAFIENIADIDGTGGGVFNQGRSHAILTNCTFVGNAAGPALYWANGGGGLLNTQDSSATVTNCIFWGNRDGNGTGKAAQISNSSYGTNVIIANYSCIQGGWTGDGIGNISLDPLFVDADGLDDIPGTIDDDLRPRSDSPCVDAGDASILPTDVMDLDIDRDSIEPLPVDLNWSPRIRGLNVDLGAYEMDQQL
jgi:hypothetical protein